MTAEDCAIWRRHQLRLEREIMRSDERRNRLEWWDTHGIRRAWLIVDKARQYGNR